MEPVDITPVSGSSPRIKRAGPYIIPMITASLMSTPNIISSATTDVGLYLSRSAVHDDWSVWLDEQSKKTGYTKAQIDTARRVTQKRPKIFVNQPVADDDDGVLCLTWRTETWTLTVEIAPDGTEEWWACSFEPPTRIFEGYEAIISVVT